MDVSTTCSEAIFRVKWLWRWLRHSLWKRHSTIVLLRTLVTQIIIFNQGMKLLYRFLTLSFLASVSSYFRSLYWYNWWSTKAFSLFCWFSRCVNYFLSAYYVFFYIFDLILFQSKLGWLSGLSNPAWSKMMDLLLLLVKHVSFPCVHVYAKQVTKWINDAYLAECVINRK